MYYHCRPLKYVEYGKVFPPPLDTYDESSVCLYKFISHYCGFFPQVWLSRSHSAITGIKRKPILKRISMYVKEPGLRSHLKISQDKVLFGFDLIVGFPVSYNHWEFMMNPLFRCFEDPDNWEKQIKEITETFNRYIDYYKEDNEPLDGEIKDWVDSGCNLDVFLKKYVFVENDQVVVPSLNLKAAKQIICRDERQKKALRKMGFIEDRIKIKNIKPRPW